MFFFNIQVPVRTMFSTILFYFNVTISFFYGATKFCSSNGNNTLISTAIFYWRYFFLTFCRVKNKIRINRENRKTQNPFESAASPKMFTENGVNRRVV